MIWKVIVDTTSGKICITHNHSYLLPPPSASPSLEIDLSLSSENGFSVRTLPSSTCTLLVNYKIYSKTKKSQSIVYFYLIYHGFTWLYM